MLVAYPRVAKPFGLDRLYDSWPPLSFEEVTTILQTELPGLAEALSPAGDVRTLPSMWAERGGLDGFYIARLSVD